MRFLLGLILAALMCTSVVAHEFAGLARSTHADLDKRSGGGVTFELSLTQGVPYSIHVYDDPARIAVRFHTVNFPEDQLSDLKSLRFVERVGITAEGSDIVEVSLFLTSPAIVDQVLLTNEGSFDLHLMPTDQDRFLAAIEPPVDDQMPTGNSLPALSRNTGDRPWIIALDPGHGGVDPGADGGRKSEADLMLLFAFELREALRAKGYDVVLTRESDRFVGLEGRISIARQSQADVFMSLHADAVLAGFAEGVTIYTLSDKAHTEADAKLAARHERHDILGGVDLTGQGDEVAQVLLEMVRRETRPRSEALGKSLIDGMKGAGMRINSKPLRQQDFAVLRAADIPSVLIELGFLSSPRDLEQINSAKGRAGLIDGVIKGLDQWTAHDAAQAALIRQ